MRIHPLNLAGGVPESSCSTVSLEGDTLHTHSAGKAGRSAYPHQKKMHLPVHRNKIEWEGVHSRHSQNLFRCEGNACGLIDIKPGSRHLAHVHDCAMLLHGMVACNLWSRTGSVECQSGSFIWTIRTQIWCKKATGKKNPLRHP